MSICAERRINKVTEMLIYDFFLAQFESFQIKLISLCLAGTFGLNKSI